MGSTKKWRHHSETPYCPPNSRRFFTSGTPTHRTAKASRMDARARAHVDAPDEILDDFEVSILAGDVDRAISIAVVLRF